MTARRGALMANMDDALEECACREDNALTGIFSTVSVFDPNNAPIFDNKVFGAFSDNGEVVIIMQRFLHGLLIEPTVALRARPLHSGAFRAVEQAKLNARSIGNMGHNTVHRVNLAHKMAFAQPANGRVTGHFAYGFQLMRHKQGLSAHARRGRRSFATRMPTANNYDIPVLGHRDLVNDNVSRETSKL